MSDNQIDYDDPTAVVLDFDPKDIVPNSKAYKEEQEEKKKVENEEKQNPVPVKRKKPVHKKKTRWKKTKEILFGNNTGYDTIGDYLYYEVFLPSIARLFRETVDSAMDKTFENISGKGYSRRRSDDGGHVVPYDRPESRNRIKPRNRINFEEYGYASRSDAQSVLDEMKTVVRDYKCITVDQILQMFGQAPKPIDSKWGWTSLRDARVILYDGLYIIDAPPPIYLD